MLVDPGVYMVDFYGFYVGKYTIVPLDRDYIFGKGSQTYTPTKKNRTNDVWGSLNCLKMYLLKWN